MTDEEFEQIVARTLEELPEEFKRQLDNVEIVIEDDPDANFELLGLYHGVPKTERTNALMLPDKITIYKNVILSTSNDLETIKATIKETVRHEIGHHFGLSDEELDKIEHSH
jgi:predicted Zn-dependent protease with MMP-like domain